MFRCQFCEFGSVHFRLLSQHYNEKHEYLPHFSVECVIEGCITRFHSVKGLKNHIKRKHPDFYRANVRRDFFYGLVLGFFEEYIL